MKKETKGRKPIPIIESTPFSEIIFLISAGINYPEVISKARSRDTSSTVQQLKTLKEMKFLNEPKKEKMLNRTRYSVNWKKINQEFIDFMHSKSQKPEFKIPEKYADNKYLSLYFERIFAPYKQIHTKTIRDIFEELSTSSLESLAPFDETSKLKELGEFSKFLNLINRGNWENENFIEKSEEILQSFAEDEEQNDLEVAKPTKNKKNKFRNTHKNIALSSENRQGENSK